MRKKVIIDHQKCCYCGDCTFSCPVGALSQPFEKRKTAFKPVRRKYDVIVIGAGPAGSMAALTCARLGLAALLIEKRQEIGSPVRCTEGVAAIEIEALVEPQAGWIAAEINRSEIQVRRGAELITLVGAGGRGYILERRIFDSCSQTLMLILPAPDIYLTSNWRPAVMPGFSRKPIEKPMLGWDSRLSFGRRSFRRRLARLSMEQPCNELITIVAFF